MLILGLLGMYCDAAVVLVTSQTLLLRLAVALLCRTIFETECMLTYSLGLSDLIHPLDNLQNHPNREGFQPHQQE